MTKYTFMYYDGRGRGELARMIFHQADVSFEDKRIRVEDWPTIKPTIPHGLVPVLYVDGKFLGESMAIARYLANEFGLAGETTWEHALCDMYVDVVQDLYAAYNPVMHAKYYGQLELLAEEWTKFADGALPKLLLKFEQALINSETGWLVGCKCTWADLHLAQLVRILQTVYGLQLENTYPHINEHCQQTHELPNIKRYVATSQPQTYW